MAKLVYRGQKTAGVAVKLLGLYQPVIITHQTPYEFREDKVFSQKEIDYYTSFTEQHIYFVGFKKVSPNFEAKVIDESLNAKVEDEPKINLEVNTGSEEVAETPSNADDAPLNEEPPKEDIQPTGEPTPLNETGTPIVTGFKSDKSKEELDAMSVEELVEYLDINYPEDLTVLIQGTGYNPGRKTKKSSILYDMVNEYKEKVIDLILA